MTKRIFTYGALTAAAIALATPALAQGIQIGKDGIRLVPNEQTQERDYRDRDHRGHDSRAERDEVSEREAVRIARRQGVRDVDSITKTRRSYRIAGIDRRGDDIRVDIDRRSGEVLSVR
ncbi:PepSY domain-containing protein [Aurantimonas sp. VKM B-3413]|uniref:PepSY domain-containing protein n=1 Tax=Aurantimonas sp. VKM B-3413 TaxID=2779401 RepID=UPI001E3D80AE|nr:PepSY domain-containing protein [Aurantimonas sp. VKM B-3413]MCB8839061.1 PepSY domain-containing protein [Aurantimonas sp. VKM B-3413]